MTDINVRMDETDAAALHQMCTRLLEAWEGDEGQHVDLATSARRRLESALRSIGWAPDGHGAWSRPVSTMGRRR